MAPLTFFWCKIIRLKKSCFKRYGWVTPLHPGRYPLEFLASDWQHRWLKYFTWRDWPKPETAHGHEKSVAAKVGLKVQARKKDTTQLNKLRCRIFLYGCRHTKRVNWVYFLETWLKILNNLTRLKVGYNKITGPKLAAASRFFGNLINRNQLIRNNPVNSLVRPRPLSDWTGIINSSSIFASVKLLCTSQIETSTSPPRVHPGYLTPFLAREGGKLITTHRG